MIAQIKLAVDALDDALDYALDDALDDASDDASYDALSLSWTLLGRFKWSRADFYARRLSNCIDWLFFV